MIDRAPSGSMAHRAQLATSLFHATGFAALGLTGVSPPLLLITWFSILAIIHRYQEAPATRRPRGPRVGVFLAVGLLALLDGVGLADRAGPIAAGRAISWATLLVLSWPGRSRFTVLAFLGTLAQVVSAGSISTSITYALSLLLFIAATAFMLTSLTLLDPRSQLLKRIPIPFWRVVTSPRRLAGHRSAPPSRSQVSGLVFGISVAIALTTLLLFFIIPRWGAGWFFSVNQETVRQVGFSDSVRFGDIGAVSRSDKVVMRVKIEGHAGPYPSTLRWRGVALDHFDGEVWKETPGAKTVFKKTRKGRRHRRQIIGHSNWRNPAVLRQRIFFAEDPGGVLFTTPRATMVWGKFTSLEGTRNQSLMVEFPAFSTHSYSVRSHLETLEPDEWSTPRPEGAPPPDEGSSQRMIRYLQLPEVLSEGIEDLARRLTRGHSTRHAKVKAIEDHLLTRFRYTLEPILPTRPKDPIGSFLLDGKAGHCEYFAASMVVMLRTVGIPSRIVNGYLQGRYNSVSDYYLIKSSDAHSWVEVYYPRFGWLTFDPTPPGPEEPETWIDRMKERIDLYLDGMKMAWSIYVIDYQLYDQVAYVRSALDWFRGSTEEEGRGSWRGSAPPPGRFPRFLLVLLGLTLALVGMTILIHRAMKPSLVEPLGIASLRYRRLMELVALHGLETVASSTPREVLERVRRARPDLHPSVEVILDWFERVRFAGGPVDPDELLRVDSRLETLRPGRRKGPTD